MEKLTTKQRSYTGQRHMEIMQHYSGMKSLYKRLFDIYGVTFIFAAAILFIMGKLGLSQRIYDNYQKR